MDSGRGQSRVCTPLARCEVVLIVVLNGAEEERKREGVEVMAWRLVDREWGGVRVRRTKGCHYKLIVLACI